MFLNIKYSQSRYKSTLAKSIYSVLCQKRKLILVKLSISPFLNVLISFVFLKMWNNQNLFSRWKMHLYGESTERNPRSSGTLLTVVVTIFIRLANHWGFTLGQWTKISYSENQEVEQYLWLCIQNKMSNLLGNENVFTNEYNLMKD